MKPLIIILSVFLLIGCNRYYMPVTNTSPIATSIKKYMEEDKIFILRDKSKAYEMRNVKLNEEEISCNLQNLSGLKLSSNTRGEINYHYRPGRPDSTISKQIHVFIPDQIINETDSSITIPINSIYKVEELKFNKAKTIREHVGTAVGITLDIASSITFSW